MYRSSLFKILSCFLFLMGFIQASDEPFDSKYSIRITGYHSHINPPDPSSDNWSSTRFINFSDVGLRGYSSREFKYQSEAKEWADFKVSGNVNIVPSEHSDFLLSTLVTESGKWLPSLDCLYLDTYFKGKTIRMATLTENIETISGWFSKEFLYRYVIELDDGTTWITKTESSPWTTPWKVGARIIRVGNSLRPYLINADEVLAESSHSVDKEKKGQHYLRDLERAD